MRTGSRLESKTKNARRVYINSTSVRFLFGFTDALQSYRSLTISTIILTLNGVLDRDSTVKLADSWAATESIPIVAWLWNNGYRQKFAPLYLGNYLPFCIPRWHEETTSFWLH